MKKRESAIVGERLSYLIKRDGVSRKELAVDVHISQSALSNYIGNRRSPDANTLLAFAEFFGTTTDYIVGINDLEKQTKTTIADDEMAVLDLYRNMTDDIKKAYFELGMTLSKIKN